MECYAIDDSETATGMFEERFILVQNCMQSEVRKR